MSIRVRNAIKKISSVIMVFALLLGMLTVSGNTITAKASESPVKLYSLEGQTVYHGISGYNVYIQIESGSAANKSVSIQYSNGSTWSETNATFYTNLNSETEIWRATLSGAGLTEFKIKYVGDNITYWDNNGNTRQFSNPLGEANVQALRTGCKVYSCYDIYAAIKNIAYTKEVKVRYTQNNWATYQEANLQYDHTITGTDTEIWKTTLSLDSDQMGNFQYCISYQVNGQTYWDNNFGANYDSSYHSQY